ncbi:EF hand [Sphingomonas guangdongensis]|uniref:EF hand n=1 Tax=Sphingomonas guangdongensis TaxID=1141890 RepID=A0A285R5Z2_9SPHN|nr:EF-hand domain-containing protein [Sphingomonas guangdongensis]SOB87757.1 EF hand [Sphingomonas guangdongensis]
MKYLLAAAVAIGTIVGGVAATAQQTSPRVRADANGDGAVSRAEFVARAEARFARIDTDRNGSLSRDERRAGRPDRGRRMAGALQRLDSDGDGKLSRAEFATGAERRWQRMGARPDTAAPDRASFDQRTAARFSRLDRNNDGFLERAELAAMRNRGDAPAATPAPSGS